MQKVLFLIGFISIFLGYIITPNEPVRTSPYFWVFGITWIVAILLEFKEIRKRLNDLSKP